MYKSVQESIFAFRTTLQQQIFCADTKFKTMERIGIFALSVITVQNYGW